MQLLKKKVKAPITDQFTLTIQKESARNGLIFARDMLDELSASNEQKEGVISCIVTAFNDIPVNASMLFNNSIEVYKTTDNKILLTKESL